MELEALRSIYEGDESFRELSPVSFQYRVRHSMYSACISLLGKGVWRLQSPAPSSNLVS